MSDRKKPLIGLTTSHDIRTDETVQTPYCPRAVLAAGGIPVILPLEASEADLRQLAAALDGFLFTGGPDVHPFLFGEETLTGCGDVSTKRDRMELTLLKLVIEQRKPLMGICRGIQLINIGLGGNIYQDIPSQVERVLPIAHQQPFPPKVPSHTVKVTTDSLLADVLSGRFFGGSDPDPAAAPTSAPALVSASTSALALAPALADQPPGQLTLHVNSTHHQAVRDVAPSLKACAFAPDGIIEGVVMEDYPYLVAVQWHPEYLLEEDPAARNLFRGLVRASAAPLRPLDA